MRALGAELVVFTPELASYTADMAGKQNLTFPICHDQGCKIADAFGLAFQLPDDLRDVYKNTFKNDLAIKNGDPSWRLPMPARFVVDKTGIIRAVDVDPDYTTRPEPSLTMAVLKSLV